MFFLIKRLNYKIIFLTKQEGNFELTDYNYMILEAFRRKNKYDTSYDGIDDYKVSKDYCPVNIIIKFSH